MKKILFLFFIIRGFFVPFFVLAEDLPNQDEITNCLSDAYTTYVEKLNACNSSTAEDIQKKIDVINQDLDYNMTLCYQAGDPEICAQQASDYASRVQKLQMDAMTQQNTCKEADLKEEYIKAQGMCYDNYSFDNVWDIPELKDLLKKQALDSYAITPEQSKELAICVQDLVDNNELDVNSSDSYKNLAKCYKQVGILENTSQTLEGTAVVLDCASETLDLSGDQSLLNLAATATGRQRQYLEQCVIKKLNPVIAGVAVLNVPFASGFGNFFLYFQFLFTQPLLLVTKRKKKSWGKVFNSMNQNPIDLATVRLLNKNDKKVSKTIVTGRNGEYLFLPKPGNYILDVRKYGYIFPSENADLEMENEYQGGDIMVDSADDVVNRYVPVDPEEKTVSKFKFNLRKWKKRLALLLGFCAPLFALVVVILIPKWWTLSLLLIHIILLFLFIRLSFAKKEPQYGRVSGSKNSALMGVTVSLFEKRRNRLIDYYVTDVFGRYFLPIAIGEYSVVFEKSGYERKQIDLNISSKEKDAKILKIDVALEKKTN